MKFASYACASALCASIAVAAPLVERQAAGPTDGDILQYALTLEHLENVFYKGGLSKYTEKAFNDANFSSAYFNNLKYIVHDEEAHVVLLTTALKAAGATPVAACEYNFPYTDVKSFVGLASVLEGVGTAAYLGAAPKVTNKDYLGVAGSILVTEALHTSVQRISLGQVAAANPYGSALGLNAVFTLAAAFIKSCPASNPALPVKAYPALTLTRPGVSAAGVAVTFSVSAPLTSGVSFVTFVSGLLTVSVKAEMVNGQISATIPVGVEGQSYAFATNKNVTAITDDVVVAGPAILEVTASSPTYDPSQA